MGGKTAGKGAEAGVAAVDEEAEEEEEELGNGCIPRLNDSRLGTGSPKYPGG